MVNPSSIHLERSKGQNSSNESTILARPHVRDQEKLLPVKLEKHYPFSKETLQDVDELKNEGLLKIQRFQVDSWSKEGAVLWVYRLQRKGRETAERQLRKLRRDELERLVELRIFNEMPLTELLHYHVETRYFESIVHRS